MIHIVSISLIIVINVTFIVVIFINIKKIVILIDIFITI